MKKLTILVVILLVAGLLTGCWLFPESKLIAIVVEPESMLLGPGDTESINSVTACYDDWTTEDIDLTDCEYLSSNLGVAGVDIEGLVIAVDSGEAVILVSYTEGKFPFKITETDVVCIQVED